MTRYSLMAGLCGLWAGLCIGGSMIAAPAKFQAETLTRSVALDVGRMQFHWVGMAEIFMVSCVLICFFTLRYRRRFLIFLPICLLVIQRCLIMPSLDARTLQIIAGDTLPSSHLHLWFIALEVMKIIILGIIALGVIKLSTRPKQGV